MADSRELVTTEAHGGVVVATIHATAIDTGNTDRLVRTVSAAIEAAGRGLRGLVLDLSAVEFINSRGLAGCIDLSKSADRAGGRAAVCGLTEDLARMIEVMRVDRILPIAADVAAARTLVLGRGDAPS
jgi:anti-anti-sigma factor